MHDGQQCLPRSLIDAARPAAAALMHPLNLRIIQQLNSLPSPLQPLSHVIPRFGDIQWLQADHMHGRRIVRLTNERQRRLRLTISEQEHARRSRSGLGNLTQHTDGRRLQTLRIVDHQIQLNTDRLTLLRLAEQTGDVALLGTDRLTQPGKQRTFSGHLPRRQHNALDAVFITTGDQRLAQQRLATALRACDRHNLITVASQVVQLGQHAFAFGGKKAKSGGARSKGIMRELVMIQQIIGATHSREDFIKAFAHCSNPTRH